MKKHGSEDVLEALIVSQRYAISEIPNDSRGIYALWDHRGEIAYIGETHSVSFRSRANKHVSGSEGRSHKFSSVYCTGRMWRSRHEIEPLENADKQNETDAKFAKQLRTAFIRKYCRVSIYAVSKGGHSDQEFKKMLLDLEARVQGIAPTRMMRWAGNNFIEAEPSESLDRLIKLNPTFQNRIASFHRQSILQRRTQNKKPKRFAF